MKKFSALVALVALTFGVSTVTAHAQFGDEPFQVQSSTFTNNGVLPLSTIYNIDSNGVNTCTATGVAGGNQSPELTWSHAPRETVSFVVVMYDVTAGFTHWGMYNIKPNANGLPANAGAPGSKYGQQILNDFYAGNQYDGPCPPANAAPDTHDYVITVYALRTTLTLPSSANFPANAETLYQALIAAHVHHEILASASITGTYNATPSGGTTPVGPIG